MPRSRWDGALLSSVHVFVLISIIIIILLRMCIRILILFMCSCFRQDGLRKLLPTQALRFDYVESYIRAFTLAPDDLLE